MTAILLIFILYLCLLRHLEKLQPFHYNNSTDTTTDTSTKEPEPHSHSYSENISIVATCTENGEKTFTCTCGDTYTEEIKALGHQYGDYTYNNDASYTSNGTKSASCALCGDKNTIVAEGTKLSYTYTDASGTKYAQNDVNVRDLPSTDGSVVGSLNKGDSVTVTGTCNETGWYRISYNGGVAYVSNSYLVDTKPKDPNAPTYYTRENCPYPLYQVEETETTITYYIPNGDHLVNGAEFADNAQTEFMKKHNVNIIYCCEYLNVDATITCDKVNCGIPHFVTKWTWTIIPPQ